MALKRNTSPEFVGIAELKRKQAEELARFEAYAAKGDWQGIHRSHYDWWMFPIDESSAHGLAYTVYAGDIAELKQDPAYIERYLRGASLLAEAWGWDLANKRYIENPAASQAWSHWPIRLYKASRSLQLFGFTEQFESFKLFALDRIRGGEHFKFGGDLSLLFTEGRPRR